jgi:hypothetical protein
MSEKDPSKIDQLLDLLLDALQERQAARGEERPVVHRPEPSKSLTYEVSSPIPAVYEEEPDEVGPVAVPEMELETAEEEWMARPYIPEKLPTINLDRMLGRLAFFVLLLTVIINIPFNRFGTNLARAMPDEQALVIRDGLVLKGDGEEIYVLEDNHKRWISSLDAFNYYGYRWEQVNLVDATFLAQFPDGPALSILRKCATSPHVYAIENGQKRWIKDIPTFEEQGYVWEDVQIVSCSTLNRIPDGPPIPPDAGEPPSP